jgi:hypothetical protein
MNDPIIAYAQSRAHPLLNGLLRAKGYMPQRIYEVAFALEMWASLDSVMLAEGPEKIVPPPTPKFERTTTDPVTERPLLFQAHYVGEGSLTDIFGDFPGGSFRADDLARYPGPMRQQVNLDLVPFWGYETWNTQNPQNSNPSLFYIHANVPGLRSDRQDTLDQLMRIEILGKA